jgi:SAM-dependent methyltransferase
MMNAGDPERKALERSFHNERFGDAPDPRDDLGHWYSAIRTGSEIQIALLQQYILGARALEYGCADGRFSLVDTKLANTAAAFHGIDISDIAISKARDTAATLSLANVQFDVMDCEALRFNGDYFDLVFGRGILHHLDLNASLSEVHRVLRPSGRAVFFEPMGHNPVINLYRRQTPHLRTPSEHPLRRADLKLAQRIFSNATYRFFGLSTLMGALYFTKTGDSSLLRLCETVDASILRIPGLRCFGWHVLLLLQK